MSERRGDAVRTLIVERDDGAVVQRKLYLSGGLLHGDLARHRAVDLVRQPVLAGNGLHLEHVLDVAVQTAGRITGFGEPLLDRPIREHRARRLAEHVFELQVDRLLARAVVDEGELHVARRLADHVERRPLAFGDTPQLVYVLLIDDEPHAFLRLVADDLLRAERRVADRQLVHVDPAARRLDELAQTVQVSARTMVVDRDDRIDALFRDGADRIVGPLLHFGIRSLHGIELDGPRILAGSHRRDGAPAHADAVVVASEQHDAIARLRLVLDAVALTAVTDAAGLHDDLVEAVFFAVLEMFERLQTTADQRLTELVAEIGSPVRRLDQDVLGRLVEPLARLGRLLPLAPSVQTRISGHINGRAGHRERSLAAGDAVAYLAARTRRRAVERLDGRREVVRLGLDRDHALELLDSEVVRRVVRRGRELLDGRPLQESAVVLIGRHDAARMLLGRTLDQTEQRRGHRLAVDDELTVEYLVAAVLRVDLREAEHLAVGQLAPDAAADAFQIGDFLVAQGQSLLPVVRRHVVDVDDRIGLLADREDLLVDRTVLALQHRVERDVFAFRLDELLDAADARQSHVLRDLDGIRAPRRDHLAPGTDENSVERLLREQIRAAQKPPQAVRLLGRKCRVGLHGVHGTVFPEK